MKRLMIVRHAKSDWDDASLSDFERPLNHRGKQAAPDMAARLLKDGIIPQYLLSSPALRAKTTADIFAKTLGLAQPSYNKAIYEASYPTLLNMVNNLPNAYNFVAIFRHNPGLSNLLFNLTGELYDMPTCTVAIIDFEFDFWNMVSADTGTITYYDYPKNGD
ncbi:phosphohistidine phosphatase [Mucilaginibacter gracilis]|uniref:Phosphohistidine phosphatase n=1 Tax=Mucilaginibacter gracilis TaxID=423350 RepID=A0A495J8X4_9SPHI|nr:histidine phosphatase family protein [Mucilaginibacter gracilis]RKR85233.1 phosphohistidine phosphatase [Mucilaginibacter gracilis]